MITADQLLAHAVGDYVLQSDWMATNKTKNSVAALVHAVWYSFPFALLHPHLLGWLVIMVSHFFIDRFSPSTLCHLGKKLQQPHTAKRGVEFL